jgi:hypothetical protein
LSLFRNCWVFGGLRHDFSEKDSARKPGKRRWILLPFCYKKTTQKQQKSVAEIGRAVV